MKWHRIGAYILRHGYEFWGSLDRKANILLFPAIDLSVFGLLTVYINKFNAAPGLGGAILGAVIFWNLVYNIQHDISFTLLDDVWSRNLYNLFATPLRLSELIVGKMIITCGKAIMTMAIILLLAAGLFHFNLFEHGPLIIYYIFNLFVFGWGFGFLTTALILRYGTKVQSAAWSLLLLLYPLSGVFYPLSILPKFLAVLATAFPISYIFEGFRQIILSGKAPSWENLAITLILNGLYMLLGISLFVLGFRNAKARGWFIHPA